MDMIAESAPFHLSFCVADFAQTRAFYVGVLGCPEGHSTLTYVDFFFYGNQLTCHVAPERVRPVSKAGLDGNHFGVILAPQAFDSLAAKLQAAEISFLVAPETQHAGEPGERRKMIFADPSGNAIEIKSYGAAH